MMIKKNSMKILYILSNPGLGGTETLLLETLPYINRLDCSTLIVNTWAGSDIGKFPLGDSIQYQEFTRKRSLLSPVSWLKILKIVRQGNFDIVHTFGLRLSLLIRLLKPFLNRPVVISLHSVNLWHKWYHSMPDALTQNFCDMFVPISQAVKKQHVEKGGLRESKMAIIPNGTDLEEFDPARFQHASRADYDLPENKTIVTTIANIRYAKGHDFYLKVIDQSFKQSDDVLFVWIGRGDSHATIQQRIRELGLDKRIKIIERVDDIRPILALSDMFVLSSREEGMPRALMEAMAMGVPCVATNVGGVPEVIDSQGCGLVAEFGDVDTFGSHIQTLLDDKNNRDQIGINSRQRIKDTFDIFKVAGYYVKLYRALLQGERNGPRIENKFHSVS